MIRDATHDDIPALVALGRVMHDESPEFRDMPYAPEKVEKMLHALIDNPLGFVRVIERRGAMAGGMVAAASEHWCSSALVAFDIGLFVAPAHRGGMEAAMLLRAYRAWAKSLGARRATAGISTGVMVEATEALYRAIGLRYVGPIFDVLEN
jgi:GNAT superfamily N-acetyltransferase